MAAEPLEPVPSRRSGDFRQPGQCGTKLCSLLLAELQLLTGFLYNILRRAFGELRIGKTAAQPRQILVKLLERLLQPHLLLPDVDDTVERQGESRTFHRDRHGAAGRGIRFRQGCLLYTSDAADE